MATRIITQIVVTGARVVGRAFTEAYKQAQASSKYAAAGGTAAGGAAGRGSPTDQQFSNLSLSEACSILDVTKPNDRGFLTGLTEEEVASQYKRLFDQNDPNKGGSFYLQSKVLRAKERIQYQIGFEDHLKRPKGPPKMFKDEEKKAL